MKQILAANLRYRGRRYTATGVAVAIATAFVVMVLCFGNALGTSIRLNLIAPYEGADTIVTGPTSEAAAETIAQTPGVTAWAELKRPGAHLVANGSELYGEITDLKEEPFYNAPLVAGEYPQGANQIALNEKTAKGLDVAVGDQISVGILADDPSPETFTVVGLFDGSGMGIVSAEQLPPHTGEAYLIAGNVADPLKGSLSDDFVVQTSQEMLDQALAEANMAAARINIMLMIFPAIAIVVAIIVISTTFQVVVQQREQELALLRCLGATGKQVKRLIVGESLLVGGIASLIGVVVGALLGALAISATGVLPTFADALPGWGAVIGTFIVGVLVTVIAGYCPAQRASATAPLVAMNQVKTPKTGNRMLVFGVLSVLGIVAMFVFTRSAPGLAMLSGLASLVFVAVFLSAAFPALIRWAAAPWRGTLARLAVGNTQRNPGRTAATGVSIFIGVALIVMTLVGAQSMQLTYNKELDSRIPVDIAVATDDPTQAPDAAAIAALPHVEEVVIQGTTAEGVTLHGLPVAVADLAAVSDVARTPVELPQGNQVFTAEFESDTGDMCYLDKCVPVEIVHVGLWDYSAVWPSPQIIEELGIPLEGETVLVRLDSTDNYDLVAKDLKALNSDYRLSGAAQMRAEFDSALNTAMLIVGGLLGVSVIVALVGVSNTLSLSVVERTRENGLLRALGMTRRQVSRMITLEALFTAVTAAVAGIIFGYLFGWAGARTLLEDAHLAFPILPTIGVVVVAVLAAIIASWLPGRKAARTSPIEALA